MSSLTLNGRETRNRRMATRQQPQHPQHQQPKQQQQVLRRPPSPFQHGGGHQEYNIMSPPSSPRPSKQQPQNVLLGPPLPTSPGGAGGAFLFSRPPRDVPPPSSLMLPVVSPSKSYDDGEAPLPATPQRKIPGGGCQVLIRAAAAAAGPVRAHQRSCSSGDVGALWLMDSSSASAAKRENYGLLPPPRTSLVHSDQRSVLSDTHLIQHHRSPPQHHHVDHHYLSSLDMASVDTARIRRSEILRMARSRQAHAAVMHSGGGGIHISSSQSVPDGGDLGPPFWRIEWSTHGRDGSGGDDEEAMAAADDVSSLGGGVDDELQNQYSSMMQQITEAVLNRTGRPSGLGKEGTALWDALEQTILTGNNRNSIHDSPGPVEPIITAINVGSPRDVTEDPLVRENWENRYKDFEEQVIAQQKENERSLRAIQRVLVDVTDQRDKAAKQLQVFQGRLAGTTPTRDGSPSPDSELQSAKRELERLQAMHDELQMENQKLRLELQQPSRSQGDGVPPNDRDLTIGTEPPSDEAVCGLRTALEERTRQLESAKMIIASLETASGALAADMRGKLKGKDDELTRAKADASENKKKLDTLAKELRELQRSHDTSRARKTARSKHNIHDISARMEKNMTDIRSLAVVWESAHDPASLERIVDLLGESTNLVKANIDVLECPDDMSSEGFESCNESCSESGSRGSRQSKDERRVKKELKEALTQLRRVEGELQLERENARRANAEVERVQRQHDQEIQSMRDEIQLLRENYNTNIQVLTKKERELAVLRDSLKVDDDVGYISDDASEAEDDVNPAMPAPLSAPGCTSSYGPSQAEALATLLAQGGRGIELFKTASGSTKEVESMQLELVKSRSDLDRAVKELKAEKQSLANAKMIISSLEQANKTMMEDLRARLQDSNTAIASLLEKSMGNERTTVKLRQELEALRKEKAEEQEKYLVEIDRIRRNMAEMQIVGKFTDEKKDELLLTEIID